MTIGTADVDVVVTTLGPLIPAVGTYNSQTDFITNLLSAVLEYQINAQTVRLAQDHFRSRRKQQIRTFEDLEQLCAQYPDDLNGNAQLAQYLWGFKMWARVAQLRELLRYFAERRVTNQPALRHWARQRTSRADFENDVAGLNQAIYQRLAECQSVSPLPPDTHLRRFSEATLGRRLSDDEVVEVLSEAAGRLHVLPSLLDHVIWAATQDLPD
jgi:hypothetical protein